MTASDLIGSSFTVLLTFKTYYHENTKISGIDVGYNANKYLSSFGNNVNKSKNCT